MSQTLSAKYQQFFLSVGFSSSISVTKIECKLDPTLTRTVHSYAMFS